MKNYNCICLDCSRIQSVSLSAAADVGEAVCSNCGRKRLALLPAANAFAGGG